MSNSKASVGNELNQKEPQKIISHLKIAAIDRDEKILAVFGSTSLLSPNTSVVSTEDRLVYFENKGLTNKTSSYLYSDIIEAQIDEDKNEKCLLLVLYNHTKVRLNIKASPEETGKFCMFVNNYKETGITYMRNKLSVDCYYRIKINAIHNNENYRIAVNNAKIHDKFQEKENKLSLEKNLGCYKLSYLSGFPKNISSSPATIIVNILNQFLEIVIGNVYHSKIPFANISGSTITTDDNVPPDDSTNQYIYYLHIFYNQDGINSEAVFYKEQKQFSTIDHIHELNYVLQHIHEKN